jgi:hypothetical protein
MDDRKIARCIYTNALAAGSSHETPQGLNKAILISAIDTTVAAICNALYVLARKFDRWRKIRLHPELAVKAFEESKRLQTPV